MPVFGGKHFSNPAVGRFKAGKAEADGAEKGLEKGSSHEGHPKSIHGHFHEDGTAHVHAHHADGTHEHTDHETHEDAHQQMMDHMGGGGDKSFADWAKEEETEPEHTTLPAAHRMGGGAF